MPTPPQRDPPIRDAVSVVCPFCSNRITALRSSVEATTGSIRCLRCGKDFSPQRRAVRRPATVRPTVAGRPAEHPLPRGAPPVAALPRPVIGAPQPPLHADRRDRNRRIEIWEIDRPDMAGRKLRQAELADLARHGPLLPSDRIRGVGTRDWLEARELGGLRTPFALRDKEIQTRIRQLARKDRHHCARHAGSPACHICMSCATTFCVSCPPAALEPLCPDCGTALVRLHRV